MLQLQVRAFLVSSPKASFKQLNFSSAILKFTTIFFYYGSYFTCIDY